MLLKLKHLVNRFAFAINLRNKVNLANLQVSFGNLKDIDKLNWFAFAINLKKSLIWRTCKFTLHVNL